MRVVVKRVERATPRKLFKVLVGFVSPLCLSACATQSRVTDEKESPDGNYTSQIVVIDTAGPGQHSGSIIVRLKTKNSDKFTQIAVFNEDLINPPFVEATWVSESNLAISYDNVSLGFQAIVMGDIKIDYLEID